MLQAIPVAGQCVCTAWRQLVDCLAMLACRVSSGKPCDIDRSALRGHAPRFLFQGGFTARDLLTNGWASVAKRSARSFFPASTTTVHDWPTAGKRSVVECAQRGGPIAGMLTLSRLSNGAFSTRQACCVCVSRATRKRVKEREREKGVSCLYALDMRSTTFVPQRQRRRIPYAAAHVWRRNPVSRPPLVIACLGLFRFRGDESTRQAIGFVLCGRDGHPCCRALASHYGHSKAWKTCRDM